MHSDDFHDKKVATSWFSRHPKTIFCRLQTGKNLGKRIMVEVTSFELEKIPNQIFVQKCRRNSGLSKPFFFCQLHQITKNRVRTFPWEIRSDISKPKVIISQKIPNLPSSRRSCCYLPCPWRRPRFGRSNHKFETKWVAAREYWWWLEWWDQHRTGCPKHCAAKSSFWPVMFGLYQTQQDS